jgi:diacylglycerol kinase (ATP)
MGTVHLLTNPAAGAGSAASLGPVVAEALRRLGSDVVPLAAGNVETARRSLSHVVEAGSGRVVVVGGDGMVNLATQVVAGTSTVLGIVPAGTGNDFASALGLTGRDVPGAAAMALADPVDIDAISVSDGSWIASVAVIGFAADVNARAEGMRRRGSMRYPIATLSELPRLKTRGVDTEVDGVARRVDMVFIAVANTARFGGGMAICPDADPTDGLLDIAVIGDIGRLSLLRVFPRVYRGTHVRHGRVEIVRGSAVTLSAHGMHLRGDGEAVGPLPLTLTAVRGALHVAGARARARAR